MGLRIPPLEIKIMLESNPLKSIMLVGRLGVNLRGALKGVYRASRRQNGRSEVQYKQITTHHIIIIIIIVLIIILVVVVVVVVVISHETNRNNSNHSNNSPHLVGDFLHAGGVEPVSALRQRSHLQQTWGGDRTKRGCVFLLLGVGSDVCERESEVCTERRTKRGGDLAVDAKRGRRSYVYIYIYIYIQRERESEREQ